MSGAYRVPMSAPDIGPEDIALVTRALASGTLSGGPYLDQLETAFAAYVGTRHAIGVTNGTSGLHLCVRAAGIADGDEVITSAFSFIASANCMLYERAVPVFVDIDEASLNLDPERPALPLSHPPYYAAYLANLLGTYATEIGRAHV